MMGSVSTIRSKRWVSPGKKEYKLVLVEVRGRPPEHFEIRLYGDAADSMVFSSGSLERAWGFFDGYLDGYVSALVMTARAGDDGGHG